MKCDHTLPSRSSGSGDGIGPMTGSALLRPARGSKGYKDSNTGAVGGVFEEVMLFWRPKR